MPDMIDTIASHVGLNPTIAHKACGALLNFLKTELDPESFARVEASVPGTTQMIADAPKCAEETTHGGLVGAITTGAEKLLGGKPGEGANLIAILNGLGLDSTQIESFLSKALELINAHVPPGTAERVLLTVPSTRSLLGNLLLPDLEPTS